MSGEDFSVKDLGDGVTQLTLHRAPVNALTPEFLDALSAFYDQIAQDQNVRALVIASGLKVLSGGLDLKAAQLFDKSDELEIVRGLNESFTKLYALPKPTICAVNGAAIAGGAFFVLASDYRIGNTRASVGLAEVKVGATLPAGPEQIAKAEIHPNDLRRMLLNGQPLDAKAAMSAGILDEVVEVEALMGRSLEMAKTYATLPPNTYATAKRQLRGAVIERIETAMKNGANAPVDGWFTAETKLAMKAMVG